MSLHCELVPVLYREYEYGPLWCPWHPFNIRALLQTLCCALERHYSHSTSICILRCINGNCEIVGTTIQNAFVVHIYTLQLRYKL